MEEIQTKRRGEWKTVCTARGHVAEEGSHDAIEVFYALRKGAPLTFHNIRLVDEKGRVVAGGDEEEQMATKRELQYYQHTMRYHGVQSDGTAIQIDSEAFFEAVAQRLTDDMVEGQDDADRDRMYAEVADPDGWSADMAGWTPAGE